MAGRNDPRSVGTLDAWSAGWAYVTAVSTARVHNIEVDQAALLDGYDKDAVISVLVEFVGRVLDALGPVDAATVCRLWGLMAAGEVPYGPRG